MRKKFGLSDALNQGITDTVNIAEHGAGNFRNTIIPMSRIEIDPENPRKMLVTMHDLPHGPRKSDPNYQEKISEYEKLKGLAATIASKGLIQPIAVYKFTDKYRIVAGHRRFMASLILEKNEIEARVFNEKPDKLGLKLVQLIENTSREDLTLIERINNVKDIVEEYSKTLNTRITAEKLHEISGLSLTTAKYYLAIFKSSPDIIEAIYSGAIQNLEKAAFIANINDSELRKRAIEASSNGANKEQISKLIGSVQELKNQQLASSRKAKGRPVNKIIMGSTKKIEVVKTMLQAVLELPKFNKYKKDFNAEWSTYEEVGEAFKRLLSLMERDIAK